METDTSTITLAFDISALSSLKDPREVMTGSYAWADNIGILTDEPIDEIIDFKTGYKIQTDFTSGARSLSESISDTFRMIATDRHIYVGTDNTHREVAEMNNWEYLSVEQAAKSAGWEMSDHHESESVGQSPGETGVTANPTDSVELVSGIGDVYADRLASADVETIGDLATASSDELDDSLDISGTRIRKWAERATELLDTEDSPLLDIESVRSDDNDVIELRTSTHQWHLVKRDDKEIVIRPTTSEIDRGTITTGDTVILSRGLAERHKTPVRVTDISYYDDLETLIEHVNMDRARPNLTASKRLTQLQNKHGDAAEYYAFGFEKRQQQHV